MKKSVAILILLILMALPNMSHGAIDGIDLKDDAYAHIFFSAWITDVCRNKDLAWWQSGLIVLGASVAKEVYDQRSTGFNTQDISFSMSGAALSHIVSGLFNINITTPVAEKTTDQPKTASTDNINHLKLEKNTSS